jgi:hypothetical protein
MDLSEAADRREIVRRGVEHKRELIGRFVEQPDFNQRPTEGDARRQIPGMACQSAPAVLDRLVILTRSTIFLGQLCERDRRRVRVDPTSEFSNARAIGRHGDSLLHVNGSRGRGRTTLRVAHRQPRGVNATRRVVVRPTGKRGLHTIR